MVLCEKKLLKKSPLISTIPKSFIYMRPILKPYVIVLFGKTKVLKNQREKILIVEETYLKENVKNIFLVTFLTSVGK